MSEHLEAIRLVTWARSYPDHIIVVRVPNHSLSARNWASQRAQGASKGFPDYLFIFSNGRTVAWELKRHGGKPNGLQRDWLKRLMDFGCPAGWGTADQAIACLQRALDDARAQSGGPSPPT